MTERDLEDLLGRKLEKKWELVLLGERMWRRESDGSWTEYR